MVVKHLRADLNSEKLRLEAVNGRFDPETRPKQTPSKQTPPKQTSGRRTP
jgi:hypothetical protein